MHRILACLILLAGAPAGASAQPAPPTTVPDRPVVVASGEATVRQAPDRAFVEIATETRAPRPQAAQQKNAELMTAVRQKLTAAGIPADAIRTLSYSLQEEFDWVDGKRVSRGYRAVNLIEVRLEDLARVGEIIDVAVNAGATRVNDIRFTLKNREAAQREALRLAVADARAKAEAAAKGAGVSLGPILRIEEIARPERPRPMPLASMRAEAADAPPTPVTPGEIEIEAAAVITVAIQ